MAEKHWWNNYPWRMVQTNLREIDMDDIDAGKFADDLEDFGATAVTLNAGGILASYKSGLPYHTVSPYLNGSTLNEIIEACHKKEIKVIARMDFSKIPHKVYEEHPEWAFRTADGGIIDQNGFVQTCQNSEYQQDKVGEILKELLSSHPFDGVYCNMSGFVATDYSGKIYGFCTCDRCKAGFKVAFGMDAPSKMDMSDPAAMSYMRFQAGSGIKLRAKMNAVVKAINPEIALDKVDYLRSESHTDIGEDIWVYSASSNSRMTAGRTRSMISDNASADFMGFRYRECSVSPGVMELRQWQNLANSGAVSFFVMGRLDNHKDKSSYEGTKKVFAFHKKHEKLLEGLESRAEVLLVSKGSKGRTDPESYGFVRALTESHIPFDEIKTDNISEALLNNYGTVILADTSDMKPELAVLVDQYAEKGGNVLVSGNSGVRGSVASLACLGITKVISKKKGLMSTVLEIRDGDREFFPYCEKQPLIAPGPELYECEYSDSVKKYLHTLPEPKFGPPEVCYATMENDNPGLTVNNYGEGRGIFIPFGAGSFYWNEGYENTLNYLKSILFGFCGIAEIAPGLHPSVEVVVSGKEGKKVISLINASGFFGNSFFEPVPMYGIELNIKGSYRSAAALNGGETETERMDGLTKVKLNKLNNFEMIVLEEN